MKIKEIHPPRSFSIGSVHIKHCADIELAADEQVTLVGADGCEYDVVRKEWGYYGTPSLNGRLRRFGFRACLAINAAGKLYVLLVERGRESEFRTYLAEEAMRVVSWLDTDDAVCRLVCRLHQSSS